MGNVQSKTTKPHIYETRYPHDDYPPSIVLAENRGKVMYACHLNADGIFGSFRQFLRCVASCREVGYSVANTTNFNKTCRNRDISFAKVGMRVQVGRRTGIIVGATPSANPDILFDGDTVPHNCHPHHNITHFTNSGEVLRCYPI